MTFVGQLRRARCPLAAFVAMGIYWGAWSAVVPAVRAAVAADDAQLGRALLCVALGAVPAMMVGGRLVDRHGGRHLPTRRAKTTTPAAAAVFHPPSSSSG